MIKRIILSIGICAATAMSVSALEMTLTPGALKNSLQDLKLTRDTRVVLTGSADVTDLSLLKEMSRTVTDLDMSDLQIVAYTYGSGNYMGQREFAAGELPKAMLLGTNVSEFAFPAETTKIGSSAFASTPLQTVTVPATVTAIGDNAWGNCKNLTSVTIQSNATLGAGLFKDCKSLRTVDFGYAVSSIPESTFDGCAALTSTLPASVTSVGAYAYRGTALTSLNLAGVHTVGDFAFAEMPDLMGINVDGDTNTTFGTGAFFGDAGLELLPSTGGSTPALLMAGTAGSTRVDIDSPVIGEAAYANNETITDVVLGPNVQDIKANAFRNLKNLETVNVNALGDTPPAVDPYAFSGLENEEGRYSAHLNVAKDTEDVWREEPVWGLFAIIAGGSDVPTLKPEISVKMSRVGTDINVESSDDITYLAVYALDGTVLFQGTPMTDRYTVQGVDPTNVVIVKVEHGKNMKVVKLAAAR